MSDKEDNWDTGPTPPIEVFLAEYEKDDNSGGTMFLWLIGQRWSASTGGDTRPKMAMAGYSIIV